MFTVYWTNFNYAAEPRFDTAEAAIAYGKGHGFDFSVHDATDLIAAWDYFGGLRYYTAGDR